MGCAGAGSPTWYCLLLGNPRTGVFPLSQTHVPRDGRPGPGPDGSGQPTAILHLALLAPSDLLL